MVRARLVIDDCLSDSFAFLGVALRSDALEMFRNRSRFDIAIVRVDNNMGSDFLYVYPS